MVSALTGEPSKTFLVKYSLSNECMLLIPSAAFYPSMTEVAGFWWGGGCVCGKPLLWAVDCFRLTVSTHTHTHTVWQSITQALKHRLRLNVQWMHCLLISSVVRDYKYRLINNIFPAIGNILSAGTKLRLNFWGLREMMEKGLELLITCTHQDT